MEDDSKIRVGYAQAIAGVAQAVVALPAGCLADRYGRSNTLKLAAAAALAIGGRVIQTPLSIFHQ